MTISSSPPVVQNPPKSSWVSGCIITVLVVLFAILGIYELVYGSIIAYVFSSAHMLSLVNIAVMLIIACDCLIYFFSCISHQTTTLAYFLSVIGCGLASFSFAPQSTDKYLNGESSVRW